MTEMKFINPYKDDNAKVILGKVILSQMQIDNLKYKGECLATDEQQEILNKYEGDEKWNHIINGHKIRDYIFPLEKEDEFEILRRKRNK